jgi:fibronectin-binding autotransporter adhesin
MAVDKKISQLTSLAQVNVDAAADVLPIVDTSATETKKITVSALVGAGAAAGLTGVDINSGTIDGTTIGASSASTGAFTTLSASSTATFNQANASTSLAPTGTGTVTINPATAGTINNMAIGGTTAAAGTFTTVTGTSVVNALGAVATPSYTFTGDLNTGMWSPTADTVAWSTGGSERMRLDTSGNLGIGNTPAGKLDVGATSSAFTDSIIRASTTGISELRFADTTINAGYVAYDHTGDSMRFGTATTERMRIDSSGNVGIGTSSPTNKLQTSGDGVRIAAQNSTNTGECELEAQVYNYWGGTGGPTYTGTAIQQYGAGASGTSCGLSNASLGVLRFQNGSAGLIYTNGSSPIVFGTTSAERMRIDSSGNVGIGTSSPGYKLDVAGSARLTNAQILYWNNSSGTARPVLQMFSNNSVYLDSYDGAFFLRTGTTPTTAITVDTSQNVGIGGTAQGNIRVHALGDFPILGGNANSTAFGATGTVPTSITSTARGFYTSLTTAASFTLSNLYHFQASNVNVGAGATVTNQIGFLASSGLTTATNNYGFYSDIASGSNRWNFYAGGTARNYFAGNTGVGEDASTTFRFLASSNSASLYALGAFSKATSDSSIPAVLISKFANDTTTAQVFVQFAINNNTAGNGQINANGASAAAFGTYSDIRLKENIVDLPSQLENICALRPVEFDYKTGGHQIGFIAQEMKKVYSDVVSSNTDEMLMITGWSKTEARLVKAIQELAAKVAALEAK